MQHYRTRLIIAAATIATILVAAAIDDLVPGTRWHILERTDKITDAKTYLVSTIAKEVRPGPLADETRLVLEIIPKEILPGDKLKYRCNISLYNSGAAFGVDTATIITRFDREKATSATWKTLPPDYIIARAPKSANVFDKLSSSTNLTVRFKTIIGETKTLTFETAGLTNAIRQVKKNYLKAKEVRP